MWWKIINYILKLHAIQFCGVLFIRFFINFGTMAYFVFSGYIHITRKHRLFFGQVLHIRSWNFSLIYIYAPVNRKIGNITYRMYDKLSNAVLKSRINKSEISQSYWDIEDEIAWRRKYLETLMSWSKNFNMIFCRECHLYNVM